HRGSGMLQSGSSARRWREQLTSRFLSMCRSAAGGTGTRRRTERRAACRRSTLGTMTATPRTPTAIDAIAEEWVDTLADLEPTLGTYIGRDDGNDRYADLSPAGHDRYIAEVRKTRAALASLEPADA